MGLEGRRCGSGRRAWCSDLATILGIGLRGSVGCGALAGREGLGGLGNRDEDLMQGDDKVEWGIFPYQTRVRRRVGTCCALCELWSVSVANVSLGFISIALFLAVVRLVVDVEVAESVVELTLLVLGLEDAFLVFFGWRHSTILLHELA